MAGAKLIDENRLNECNELLEHLDIDLNDLSPHANELLTLMANYKQITNLQSMDPMSVHCWYSDRLLERIELEPHILAMELNIKSSEKEIKEQSRILKEFKNDLELVKKKFNASMSEEDFLEKKREYEVNIKIHEEKLTNFEASLQKCHIPMEILPESIKGLNKDIEVATEKRNRLKDEVYNVNLVRSAKKDLSLLRLPNKK